MLYSGNQVYAASNSSSESNADYKNIIAIIVNDKIYGGIKNELEWYVEDYIQ
jgi:hypothetical protein